jgi:hypothetical protein
MAKVNHSNSKISIAQINESFQSLHNDKKKKGRQIVAQVKNVSPLLINYRTSL